LKVIFSELAKAELDDATLYYELEFEGLGKRFKENVRQAALFYRKRSYIYNCRCSSTPKT
jgi:hypothetical protein